MTITAAAKRSHLTAIVEESLPSGTIVGTTGLIPDEKVEFIHKLILDSGIPQQIDGWDAEDNFGKHAGGRPRGLSTAALLTLALVCTTEGSSQEVEEFGRLIHERLSDEMLQLLEISTKKRAAASKWYPLVRNAFDRMLKPLDSHPGAKKKFPTQAEVAAMLAARDPEEMELKQRRLDWVANTLLLATKNVLPEEVWESWQGDLTVDATVVPAYGKKGAPFQGAEVEDDARLFAVESDAGWYFRNANHDPVKTMKLAKKAVFGWELTLTAMANHNPKGVAAHPLLVLGIGMTRPGKELISTALNSIEFIASCGHPTGRLTGDRGYMAAAKAEDLSIPLRLLGYDIVTDYKVDQLGNKGGGFAGALMVEGAFYCPAMPKNLVEATAHYRAGKTSFETWTKRIESRRNYRLRPAEKTDDKGRTPMMCPARGSGATAICPLANPEVWNSGEPYDETKTEILNPPAATKCGDICKNKKSVSFPMEAGAKLWQTHHFGSKEWHEMYRTDRSTIEGINGALKTATIPIDDATKRRRRGYTAQYLLLTMLVATENLARIQSFRDTLLAHPTEEAYERHTAKRLARKVNRKAEEAHRANSWDAFQKQNAAQREANARVVRGTR